MRPPYAAGLAALLALTLAIPARAVTPNGRLQIIHLDVGQGDGCLLISPLGQTVLIDEGPSGVTPAMGVSVVNQLKALGVTRVNHHFASHYHTDHIGNFVNITGTSGGIPVDIGWDRGGSYTTQTYMSYASALGNRRRTLVKNQIITLDSLSAHPVWIKVVDLAGAGVIPTPTDENALCLALKVTYGEFDEAFGGDLTGGAEGGTSPDIESRVASAMGPVEVYKVHHHGSRFSSNTTFLSATSPKLAVISCGTGNSYGHPAPGALGRLHNAGVKTYWTETGSGVAPDAAWDKVSNGQVVISATWEPGGVDTIRGTGFTNTFTNSGTPVSDVTPPLANLSSPDGGEVWKVGSSHSIAWTATDGVGVTAVDLAWSADGGTSWSAIAGGIANSGAYSWTVPAEPTVDARVRVVARDAAGNRGADSSFASFSVDYWMVTASASAGGSITPSGVVDVAEGASSNFVIAPGTGWQIAGVQVDGVPVGALAAYQFTGVAANHTIAAEFLDIAAPQVVVTAPSGGEVWEGGSAHDITWTAADNAGVDSVTVEYSLAGMDGPWIVAAHGIASAGSYSWAVPPVGSDSARVRVTAYDHALNAGTAMSAGPFSIGATSVAVTGEPAAFRLDHPLPNPTRGPARVRFSLPHPGPVRLDILDLSGRRVWHAEGRMPSGIQAWTWDGRASGGGSVGAGLYFVRLETPWGTRAERLVRLQ